MSTHNRKNVHRRLEMPFLSELYQINNCHLKKQYINNPVTYITKKRHHHTFFEVHFITDGYMSYDFEGETAELFAGDFLIISPEVNHKVDCVEGVIAKYALLFSCGNNPHHKLSRVLGSRPFLKGKITADMSACLEAASDIDESRCLPLMRSHKIFEVILSLAIAAGLEDDADSGFESECDARLALAKQYIKDNINSPLTCPEVSQYCHLSCKQLSRIFSKNEGMPLMGYIHKIKIEAAEKLISESGLSLKEISSYLGFSSEYYFNAFFKKHAGMTPGEYRKSLG